MGSPEPGEGISTQDIGCSVVEATQRSGKWSGPGQAQGQLVGVSTMDSIGFSGPLGLVPRDRALVFRVPPRQVGPPIGLPEGPDKTGPHLPCGLR